MEKKEGNKARRLAFRVSEDEYQFLLDCLSKTTCKSISEYLRKALMCIPITKICRNQSLDELMEGMIRLRKELKITADQYTRIADQLPGVHRMQASESWFIIVEIEREALFNRVDEIKNQIQKMAETWLQ